MKKLIVFIVFLFSSPAFAVSAHDIVTTWLMQSGLPQSGFRTCDPSPDPIIGSDGICAWGAGLGTQPSSTQLKSLIPALQSVQDLRVFGLAAQATYSVAVNSGIVVTSTSMPAINGTYSVTSNAQANIGGIIAGIAAGQGLPHGASTVQWLDAAGAPHSFTAVQITALGAAIRDYVYDLIVAQATASAGGHATWPASSVTIP